MAAPQQRTVLIDGDIALYMAACAFESKFDFGDGEPAVSIDEEGAKTHLRAFVNTMMQRTKCSDYLFCLTHRRNFRYTVLPTYKHNRKDNVPPQLLRPLKDWARMELQCKDKKWLEADDLIGIFASRWPQHYVACSIDKDFESIPCTLFNWKKDKKPRRITQTEADYKFHYQWMMGDSTDGYSGIYRCGPKCAEKILAENPPELWTDAVIELYAEKCYSWEYILQQARMARILRHDDWDWDKGEVILWTP